MISLAYLIPYRRASALKAYLFMTYSGGGGGGGGGVGGELGYLICFQNWLTLAYLSLSWILIGLCSKALQSFLHY